MSTFYKHDIEGLKWEGRVWYAITFYHEDTKYTVKELWDCPECGTQNKNREFVPQGDWWDGKKAPPKVDLSEFEKPHQYKHVQGPELECRHCLTRYRREPGPSGGPLVRMNYRMLKAVPRSRADLLFG